MLKKIGDKLEEFKEKAEKSVYDRTLPLTMEFCDHLPSAKLR